MAVHSQDPALLLALVDEVLDAPVEEPVLLEDVEDAAPEDVELEVVELEDVELEEELPEPERESVR